MISGRIEAMRRYAGCRYTSGVRMGVCGYNALYIFLYASAKGGYNCTDTCVLSRGGQSYR